MKFIDLFAGIGGFRYGLETVNNEYAHLGTKSKQEECKQGRKRSTFKRQVQLHDRNWTTPFCCVWSNEWDKYASDIYKKHFGECDTRDIRTVKSGEIPDFDLLVGGFPCQAFSIAGKRKGFNDTRGTLFFEIARILADKRPRHFLLENVKGLLSHDEGKTFQTILGVLTDLGYEYQWQVLNSKNFGVPQNRERVFIIGNLRGTPRPKVFPIGSNNEEDFTSLPTNKVQNRNKERTDYFSYGDTEGGVDSLSKSENWKNYLCLTRQKVPQAFRIRGTEKESVTIQGKAGGTGAKTGLYKTKMGIRRLTPTECERLQGFPDGWTEGISDTQRYKCLGNAVTTNVVTWIGENLI